MKLNSFTLGAVILVMIFGGISFTTAMNWWETETTKEPVRYAEGEAAGQYNPADIRGSYTFGDVSNLFNVPLSDLQAAFRIPAETDPAGYKVKDLEVQFETLPVEMGTSAVRMFVAFYKGLPYEVSGEEESYLFPEAAQLISAKGLMTAEQQAYLETHIVQIEEVRIDPAGSPTALPPVVSEEPAPVPTEHLAPEMTVTGKTTFYDLLNWGLAKETIEGILGEPMPGTGVLVKDYATSKGLTFSELKARLQAEIDRLK